MIDIGKILKRAWHILWNYKILWIFGVLLAITAGGNGGSNGSSGNTGYQFSPGDGNGSTYNPAWVQDVTNWFEQNLVPLFERPLDHITTFIWIGVALLLFILIVGTIFAIIRYVSETSVIRMVNEYEQTGKKVGFKQGWKMGWNRRAFRLWVIDLVVNLPVILFLGVLGLGLLVYFSVKSGSQGAIAISIVAAIGCSFLFIFAFFILMVLLRLLRQFFVRFAALENTSVGESFRRGWQMFKCNWKSAALMWLVMFGIGIGLVVASLIAFFLLIPVYAVLLLPAAILAVIPGLLAFGITSIFSSGVLAWIIAGLVALPFFFVVVFAPLTLITGWIQIYNSSVWTLTYREMKVLEGVVSAEVSAPVK
jgi:hypothetical protein